MKMQWREKKSAKRQGNRLGHCKGDCFWRWKYNKNRLKSLKMQNQCQRKEAKMTSKLVCRQLSHSTSQILSIGGRHPGIFSHTKLLGMLYVLTRMEKLDLYSAQFQGKTLASERAVVPWLGVCVCVAAPFSLICSIASFILRFSHITERR